MPEQKQHLTDAGSRPCIAPTLPECRAKYNGEPSPHFDTFAEADAVFQRDLTEKYGTTGKPQSKKDREAKSDEPVNYNLMKRFKELEDKYEKDFQDYPTRFFSADLASKSKVYAFISNFPDMTDEEIARKAYGFDAAASAAYFAASTPEDGKTITTATVRELATDMGYQTVDEITDPRALRSFKADRAWRLTDDDGNEYLVVPTAGAKVFNRYSWRSKPDGFDKRSFTVMDGRTLVGASRIKHKTGVDGLLDVAKPGVTTADRDGYVKKNLAGVQIARATLEAQEEGVSFRQQRKFIRESGGSVASAWEDKKNYSKAHRERMETTVLNKWFSKVDIDDSVDLEEFDKFERDYAEIREKLPPIPDHMKPRLGVRLLGKHNADGLYSPTHMAVMVDVRNTGSFIHEMGHHLDLAVHDNASLSNEFAEIKREYSRTIKFPEGTSAAKMDYFQTSTEVNSRLFERFANIRLGIENSLVDTTKHDGFDYAPFKDNPELEAKGFAYLEKLFGYDKQE